MNDYRRTHPAAIALNLGRVFYLLFIPVLRGAVAALRGGFSLWLQGAWMDILVFLAMLGIACVFWLKLRFRCDGTQIGIRSGFFNLREIFVPWENVAAIVVTKPFFLRPIKAVSFRADTPGGGRKDPDVSLLLSEKQLKAILENRGFRENGISGKIHQSSTLSIVALSLLTSNSFGGIIFISTFISQSGKLLGREFSQRLVGTLESVARSLDPVVSPAAAAIAYALVAGWFIGFLLSFFRYKSFTLERRNNALIISGGMFTRREYFIRGSDLNFIDVRQSVATRALGLYSLYLSATGYGKRKDDISCVIPTEPGPRFRESLGKIFPDMLPAPRKFSPGLSGVLRFVSLPISCLLFASAAIGLFLRLFPMWSGFIWFSGLMAYAPALVFLAVRVIDAASSGVAFHDGCYTLRYSKGLSLHTVVIPDHKVVAVELRRSFFQRFGPYCDVVIRSRAEGRSAHRCRSLAINDMTELFGLETSEQNRRED